MSQTIFATVRGACVFVMLALAFSLSSVRPAQAQSSVSCSSFGGVLDGFAGDIAPSSIEIDQNCTIRNFPASNPLRTNFNFFTQPGQTDERWLIVFDNVVHTGNMSCNSVLEHKIWFTNGSSTKIQEGCQNLLIPVEKIEKANPAGTTTVTVGVPFTYTLTMPVLFDAGTGTVINNQGSLNDLHSVTLTDDLNATGADLTYVSHRAYWLSTDVDVPHTFTDVGGLLTFDGFPIIPAGEQIVIELTVVLDASPTNTNGTTFFNTAKWDFGRLIEGVFYEPLPGEWGITPPLTISGPDVTLTKSGPAFMNLGDIGDFMLDVQNIGDTDAWNVTILDELPNLNGPVSGGMCDTTPTISGAQVFASDGVTPVPGKGPLAVGTDIVVTYSSAPFCELTITVLSAGGTIGPGERLIVTYQTELDVDTENGVGLTNIAGVTEWFNGDPSIAGRQTYVRAVTDGTPGTLDHEDEHTLTASLFGSFFNKTVVNATTGAATATPGDTLRYTLRLRTTDSPLTSLRIFDDLGALNAVPVFEPGTLTWVQASLPVGADISNTDANGGSNGTGFLDIRNLNVPVDSELVLEFEVTLVPILANGLTATNQAEMTAAGAVTGFSDDPTVNGPASPDIDGDEDPTSIPIVSVPVFDIDKISTYLDGDPTRLMAGERIRYTITVANIGTDAAVDSVLRDQVPANTTYIANSTTLNGAAVPDLPSGASALTQGLTINAPSDPTPGSMPPDPSASPANVATIVFDVLVDSDVVDGTILSNQAFVSAAAGGVVDQPSDDPRTPAADDPTNDVVANLPQLYKTVTNATTGAATATPGDTLRYTLSLQTTDTPLTDLRIFDDLGALNAVPVFEPGTLTWDQASLPVGADISNTDANGGSNGTGFLDIRNLNVPANSQLVLEFEVTLAPILANGLTATNQAEMTAAGAVTGFSDDPTVNGPASPDVNGDEDPTSIPIVSVPAFDIDKISTDLDGDPTRLMAGERLRYTITVANIGTDAVVDAVLRDQVPANTAYIANSTTLNGVAVPDLPSGASALTQGLTINAPSDPTPGSMPSDPSASPANVATVVFDVLVDADLVDGTILSNQAFGSAVAAGIADVPSDDPRTPVADDPTRDIVGNLPLLYAEKSAVLVDDFGTPGVVDPGDTLRYTIAVYNNGPIAATEAVLTDAVPTNTTYVADSTTINGLSVGADGGVSPLIAGLPISSSDLTPPLPGAGAGMLTQGESAVIEFDVLVDAGLPPGTLIVNQATAATLELPPVLTDGDGNPATGPEPTVVVVGPAQQLSISKQVAVVGGGPALAGSTLEYTVRVQNIGAVPAFYVTIYDDLDMPTPGYLTYVANSAMMDGLPDGVVVAGSLLTADYFTEYGPLDPGGEVLLRFQAVIDPNLATGTVVTNTADVEWNDPRERISASVSVTVGGVPGVGLLSGTVWHDANFDDVVDVSERLLEGWTVELFQAGDLIHTTQTDVDGNYQITGVIPGTLPADRYELVFTAPGAGPNTAALGRAFSADFTNGLQRISDIAVQSGSVFADLHLPIDPNGVVYNAVGRIPVAGAVLTMLDATSGTPLPAGCFDDPQQQDQVTLIDGYYKFDINFSGIACPEGGDYLINVTPPSAVFISGPSETIPPTSSGLTSPLSVPGCLQGGAADAIPATTLFCESTTSEFAPSASVAAQSAGTVYYLHLTLDNSSNPGSRQIFNNHIPLDPDLADAVTISKTTPLISVNRGQLVPYIITVENDAGFALTGVSIVDRFPAGFKYVEGSARIDGTPTEPSLVGRELYWSGLALDGAGRHRIELLLAVGAGVSEGDFVNRAQVIQDVTGDALSIEASVAVRLVPDPDFDCTDVMGKVFDDSNRNGIQDIGEAGIPGVRLVTATGLAATTDPYGRYHITCATVPNESRGSNFVMKLDDRTLPTGFRASKDSIQIARATRGKALRFNFGASIHRVIGLDMSDPIFEPGLPDLRRQWEPRIGILLDELVTAPAVLRLSYLAENEDPGLVDARLEAVEDQIRLRWEDIGTYELEIEPDVIWRLGKPSKKRPREGENQ